MKRVELETTSPVVAGRMEAADFSFKGAAEPGVFGNSGRADALDKSVKGTRLHMTSAPISLCQAQPTPTRPPVHRPIWMKPRVSPLLHGHAFGFGDFGTLTLGDNNGAFDKSSSRSEQMERLPMNAGDMPGTMATPVLTGSQATAATFSAGPLARLRRCFRSQGNGIRQQGKIH